MVDDYNILFIIRILVFTDRINLDLALTSRINPNLSFTSWNVLDRTFESTLYGNISEVCMYRL